MDFFHTNKTDKPQRGDLLISEPFLPDPNFERSVVYLCEHDENGSFGFVLNQQSQVDLDQVIEEIPEAKTPVYIGGPVERNTLHFLHRTPELLDSSKEICNGIMWGANFDKLVHLIDTGQIDFNDIRFFVGYSGWSPGQLEEELQSNSWIVFRGALKEHVFDFDSKDLWKQVMNQLGGKYRMMSNYPTDPRLN